MSHLQDGPAAIGPLRQVSACTIDPSHDLQSQRTGARGASLTNGRARKMAPAIAPACQQSSRAL
jgi:hypothetical protein